MNHPANDWEWEDTAEVAFQEWFNGDYGNFTLRCEWFYGDCAVEDLKTREDLLRKWLHSAFLTGYNTGRCSKTMNNDMPWVNLTQEEVKELRNKKHELTEYGKEQLRKLMTSQPIQAKVSDEDFQKIVESFNNPQPYPDEMFEEAERREKSNRVLERYNRYYNMECAGMPHGTPITPEHQQMITLQSMIDALRCENLNHEFDVVPIADIEDLIERLREQANEYLKTVKEFKDSADGVA